MTSLTFSYLAARCKVGQGAIYKIFVQFLSDFIENQFLMHFIHMIDSLFSISS